MHHARVAEARTMPGVPPRRARAPARGGMNALIVPLVRSADRTDNVLMTALSCLTV